MPATSIDVQLVYDRFIGDGDSLAAIQRTLKSIAPTWCARARIYRSSRDQQPVDLNVMTALSEAVLDAAAERGATYRALVAEYGAGDERLFGSTELRGTPDLIVVIRVDECPVSRLGEAVDLGNTVTLQLRRGRVQGQTARSWGVAALERLAETTSPAWGAMWSREEYFSKVMSDGPGTVAVGRDFGRFLPGLFTVNYFGTPYADLIGRERLLAPSGSRAVGDGVLIEVGEDPSQWDTEIRRDHESETMATIGPEYFFAKTETPAETVAPPWSERL